MSVNTVKEMIVMKQIEYMSQEELTRELVRGQKKQTGLRVIAIILNALILLSIAVGMFVVIPPALGVMSKAGESLDELNVLADQAKISMENADSLMKDADGMISDNSAGIADIMVKLNGIDFVKLNEAIQHLADIVEPLARLFGGGKQ